jgi:hypothetical protein
MNRIFISALVAGGLLVTTSAADAAKPKKQESEVQKALKAAYPDAQTQITGTNEVNGVKVYDVKVTTPKGESTAQVTDYGDFLMYGVPHEYGAIRSAIQQDVSGLFAAKPEDIDMYRVTNYYVDFQGPKGKNYMAAYDALGNLKDITTSDQQSASAAQASRGKQIKDDATVKKLDQYVKRELPNAAVEAVYQGPEGSDFRHVQLKGGGEVVVNDAGQIYSLREPIVLEDLPQPIADSIKNTFTAPVTKLWRGEYEYYQFNQQNQRGQPIVVKMRPNGDILEVRNDAAAQEEQAVQAKSKTKAKAGGSAEKKG